MPQFDTVPEYVSLRHIPGLNLPEPINHEHRMMLWRIADSAGEQVTEGEVVTDVTTWLHRSNERFDRRKASFLARTALLDIYQDGLAISVANSALTRVDNESRRIQPTPYGLLIVAEDTRRVLQTLTDRRTIPRAQRIHQKSLAFLLKHPDYIAQLKERKS